MRGGIIICAVTLLTLTACAPERVTQQAGATAEPADAEVTVTQEEPPSAPSQDTSDGDPIAAPSPQPSPVRSPSPAFEPRAVTINVSGDLLWHNTLFKSAVLDARAAGTEGMDFAPQLASLKPFVERADIGVCHAEVPLAPEGGPYTGYPMFGAPHETLDAIVESGWDVCTTASNHTMDKGWEGLVRTVDEFESAGILAVGTHRTEEEASAPQIHTTDDDVKVGFVSQTYGLNGLPKSKGRDWSVALIDADTAIRSAKAAKEAGADIVAVHIHAGDEYVHSPNAQQREFAEKVTASEYVDFVFGQHAHVVQPIDKVNDKWVLYGSGNLIAQSGPAKPYTYDGYLAEIKFVEEAPGEFVAEGVEWAPTYITKHQGSAPARVHLIPAALEEGVGDQAALEKSAERTRKIVEEYEPDGLVELTSIS